MFFSISGTKFCESILLPTEFTLKKSFEATFVSVKDELYLNETDRVDLCCRSLHKCDAHKHIEFNYKNESNIRHCKCVYSFQNCLKNLNTSLSNELAFFHSVNTTRCYAKEYPIIKCITFDSHKKESTRRCLEYDLDQSQPQKLQIFDVPFNNHALSAFKCKSKSINQNVLCYYFLNVSKRNILQTRLYYLSFKLLYIIIFILAKNAILLFGKYC